MTTLDGVNLEESENDDSVRALVSLLAMCIKSVPKEILQVKFSNISKTLLRHFEHYKDSEHNIILKSVS
jgi:ribosomal RNA-processing protein 12